KACLSLLVAVLAFPAAGQETRIGEKVFRSPPAALSQFGRLEGQWLGDGIGGAPAMESWLLPIGGTMVGTFVQQAAGGEILFTEHMYLMEEEGTLVLRLKHFNADLTGREKEGRYAHLSSCRNRGLRRLFPCADAAV
ncbi:DUF6265 family protein, partial [Altererythrobacter sp.]|nr:DUF6265 family protein [Altererythrobacter sp.]